MTRQRQRWILISLLIILINCYAFSGIAAEENDSKTADDNVFTLGRIEVTAKSEPVRDITTDSIEGEDMRTFNRDNVADALNLVPGVTLSRTGARNEHSDEKLTDIPRHKIFTHLRYSPVEPLNLLASLEYNADRFSNSDGKTEADSYTLVNLKADCGIYEGLRLEVGVNNVFDENYEIDEGYPEAGRNYFTNLTYRF